MGAVKEFFINNCPYREKFDDYGTTTTRLTATRVTIHPSGLVTASEHTKTVTRTCPKNAHAQKKLGCASEGSVCS